MPQVSINNDLITQIDQYQSMKGLPSRAATVTALLTKSLARFNGGGGHTANSMPRAAATRKGAGTATSTRRPGRPGRARKGAAVASATT